MVVLHESGTSMVIKPKGVCLLRAGMSRSPRQGWRSRWSRWAVTIRLLPSRKRVLWPQLAHLISGVAG
jgi:hypothetical protein